MTALAGQCFSISEGALNKNNDLALFAATSPMMSYIMCICTHYSHTYITLTIANNVGKFQLQESYVNLII